MPSDATVVWNPAYEDLLRHDPRVRFAVERIASGAAVIMAAKAPAGPPRSDPHSGHLRRTIEVEHLDRETRIGPTADYAKYVNDDTRPHIIRSHGPYPLRNRLTGQVFGRIVHHPGTRGQHFIERTAREIDGKVIHI